MQQSLTSPVQMKPVEGIINTLNVITDVQNETEEILGYVLNALVGKQLEPPTAKPEEPLSHGLLSQSYQSAQWRLEQAQHIRNSAAKLRDALLD